MRAVRRGRTNIFAVRLWRTAQIIIACEFIHRLFGGDAIRLGGICNPALKKLQDLLVSGFIIHTRIISIPVASKRVYFIKALSGKMISSIMLNALKTKTRALYSFNWISFFCPISMANPITPITPIKNDKSWSFSLFLK